MNDPLLEQLLVGFVDEAEEIASRLTLNLLELERRGGGRSFDDLARGLHTLKGSAATLGLDALSELAHKMEDSLLPLRGRPGPLPGPIADATLRALDAFLAQLRHLAGKTAEPRDLAPVLQLLEQEKKAISDPRNAPRAGHRHDSIPGISRVPNPSLNPEHTRITPRDEKTPAPGAHNLLPGMVTSPGGVGSFSPAVPTAMPSLGQTATPISARGAGNPPSQPPPAPLPFPRLRPEDQITPAPPIARPLPPLPPRSEPPPAFDSEPPRPTEDGWRVGARQVVGLLREAERLREVRLRIDERRREVERALSLLSQLSMRGETADARAQLTSTSRALAADSEEAADVLAQLEDGLKSITTLPVRTVLEPLRRSLRDICRAQGKEARLAVVGAEISLDRRVLEGLRGPLMHLIRNAVDHGLEMPAEREAAGKHREGAITIRIEQQGNMLFLEIADDGHGLDVARIRAAALEKGVATETELSAMTEQQLKQVIFRPGLSTRTEITELSGRGVGLDVARAQLQALRGQIEAHSVQGQGTRFLLTLPADLGSSPVLVVRVGEHLFGVPMAAIESSRAARAAELRAGRGRMQLEHREQLVQLLDLGAMLGLRQPSVPAEGTPLLILLRHGARLAIAIDEVIGDKDLLIRALPPEMREIAAWQGAATLARGELILVLRADWLVQAGSEEPRTPVEVRRALVVDDSLTARALHRTALEAGGWHVHTASSGEQALEQLKHASYDVMVADIGMAPMDGLELTRAVRSEALNSGLPIILVSAHDGPADRERGQQACADGFLSKRDCASGRLLSEVAAVIARRRGAA